MKNDDDTPADHLEEKVVSLNLELANLAHGLRGAQLLAELLANHDMPSEQEERQAPRSIIAILLLVDARLQQLRWVIQGEVDARHLWAPHNATTPRPLTEDDVDVRLESGSSSRPAPARSSKKVLSRSTRRKSRADRAVNKPVGIESAGGEAAHVPPAPASP
ncbi:hypothetical protein K8640_42025 [Myxococcus sp. XM-1-1-1]|uniref:hypothetical protein n=1 Tax=Myxococcus sp. XM-1-1-1 TaxID=2874602 RepID=UPI001CBBAA68|nr:hypothetical protein [Myxococcus sp. XM-1-1-1]MBZ4414808.1 hypothetical protein [Myxococcus sp. XM-1-1-1]